ncbi:F-box/FBD/LRR-repeat protein [Quillaja saponaria]|uniref:F-box/FBD/LRR-repeat protein n=1 Tax=Quillaja saponaria TaxID=32244 RepID=A0AAD7KZJ4_QUISA|nr:F-box/FBD/LRR-repeat protein [Quillaja saponaria]
MVTSALTLNGKNEKLSKRQKVVDDEDLISNLPESILSHILSLLPTKDAVRTCVLSTRWIYNWTFITTIDMNDTLPFGRRGCWKKKKEQFVNFVDKVLLHLANPSIERFSLSMTAYQNYDLVRVNAWISSVLRRGVQKLHIHLSKDVFVSSRSLFNCNSLLDLKLDVRCTLRVPSSHFLSNLKLLHLCGVKFLNDSFPHSTELVLNFPVLKEFKCICCKWLNAQCVSIETPQLESFHINSATFESLSNGISKYSVKINSSHLRKFSYSGYQLEDVILLNPSCVLVASIVNSFTRDEEYIMLEVQRKTCMLLAQLCEVERLKLEIYFMKFLARGRNLVASLPTFDKLIHLEIDSVFTPCETLLDLLHKTPSLESLTFKDVARFDKDLLASMVVPACISSNLKVVKLKAFEGVEHEIWLAKFFLENAKVLELMAITKYSRVFTCTDMAIVEQQLLSASKISSAATVKFLTVGTD